MQTIRELREKQARIATNARQKFDEINDDTPEERAAEINREFDAMMAEVDKINDQIERQERLERFERSLDAGDSRRPMGDDAENNVDEGEGVSYRQAFFEFLQCGADPTAMSAEARQVLRNGYDNAAFAAGNGEERTQVTSSNAAGGYTVPEEMRAVLIRAMAAWGPMYDEDICTPVNTSGGNPIPVPTVDDTSNEADAHTEGDDVADDNSGDVVFGEKMLNAYVYKTPFIKFSFELGADSVFNMESLLGSLLGERLGRIANRQLTVGSGSGAPNGIMNSAPVGLTAASATALASDEILEFVHSVDPAYRSSPKARAMFNDNTLLVVRKLKDGQGNYLITEAPDGSGRLRVGSVSVPYSVNQACASIAANATPMAFGDFSKYFVRKVGNPVIGVMRERFWPNLGIAGLIRLDGELGDDRAIKKLQMASS